MINAGNTADRPTEPSRHPFYPADLAFVVKLRRDAEMGADPCLGRAGWMNALERRWRGARRLPVNSRAASMWCRRNMPEIA